MPTLCCIDYLVSRLMQHYSYDVSVICLLSLFICDEPQIWPMERTLRRLSRNMWLWIKNFTWNVEEDFFVFTLNRMCTIFKHAATLYTLWFSFYCSSFLSWLRWFPWFSFYLNMLCVFVTILFHCFNFVEFPQFPSFLNLMLNNDELAPCF